MRSFHFQTLQLLAVLACLFLTDTFSFGEIKPDKVVLVWPGIAPGETGNIGAEMIKPPSNPSDTVMAVTNVSKPTLSIFRPDKARDTKASVIICPGGGYKILAWNLEGTEIAHWFTSLGVTAIVLKYRVPVREGDPVKGPVIEASLQDGQRAVSLVRSKAAEWSVDPNKIGLLGFSAGGNLTAFACTEFEHRHYAPIDQVDTVSCRPDFGVLIYPAWLIDDSNHQRLRPELKVTSATPPMFIVQTGDDPLLPEGSVQMYLALHQAGVKAELHIFQTGGHGYGMRSKGKPISGWPLRLEEWMRSLNWI